MKAIISSIGLAILATALYILGIEILGFWVLFANLVYEGTWYIYYYYLIQGILQFSLVILFTSIFRNNGLKSLISKTNKIWYLVALGVGCTFVFIQSFLDLFYNLMARDNHEIIYRFDGVSKFLNPNLLSTVLFIPIAEELFFREYLQKTIETKTNTITAILIASLMFSILHAPYSNLISETFNEGWHRSYITFFGGIIAGVLLFKSKSVGPPILFHMSWNIMATIV